MPTGYEDFAPVADWKDKDQIFTSGCLDQLKEAADEKVAFKLLEHDSNFPSDHTFPDDDTVLVGVADYNAIKNSTYPEECVKTDEIKSSGSSRTPYPAKLSLAELLTDALNYAGGQLLFGAETVNGTEVGVNQKEWIEQLYQVANYPEFFWRPLKTKAGGAFADYIIDLQVQDITVRVDYRYTPGGSFISAWNYVSEPFWSFPGTNIYQAGDLNEAAPFSTPQQVRDYAIATMNSYIAADNWSGNQNNALGLRYDPVAMVGIEERIISTSPVRIECTLYSQRIRFKLADHKRAESPNKYTCPVLANYSYENEGSFGAAFDDFGLGVTEGLVNLETLTKSGDWYILEVPGADYDNTAVLPVTAVAENIHSIRKLPIPPDIGGSVDNWAGYYVKPSQNDGSAWKYYKT